LAERLGQHATTAGRPEVLIAQHGCIIARRAARAIDVHLRPNAVSPIALGALLYDLKEADATRIVLNTSPADVTIFPTLSAFISQIDHTITPHKPARWLQRRPSAAAMGSALADLMSIWDRDRGGAGLADAKRLIVTRLSDRHLEVDADATRPHLLVDSLGTGFRVPDPRAFRVWSGQRLTEHPDLEYGRWVAQSFTAVLTSGAPLAEDIDCDIHWHGFETRRHRYTRLILPFDVRPGRRVLLGTTITDVDFDLRAPALAASA
jgi:hypothetical protein